MSAKAAVTKSTGGQKIIKSGLTLPIIQMDIWSYLEESFEENKDLIALECWKSGKTYTYEDVTNGSAEWAATFASLSRGTNRPTVALMLENVLDTPMVYLGAFRSGCRVFLINPHVAGEERISLLAASEAFVIVSEECFLQDMDELQEALGLKAIVFGLSEDDERSPSNVLRKHKETFQKQMVNPDSDSVIFCTSGTSGTAKAIVFDHNTIVNGLEITLNYVPKQKGVQLPTVSQPHLMDCTNINSYLLGFKLGNRIILTHPYSIKAVLEVSKKYNISALYLHHGSMKDLVEMDNTNEMTEYVKMIFSIGMVPLSSTFQKINNRLENRKILFANCYGCSEVGFVAHSPITGQISYLMKLGPNVELRIIDLNTKEDLGPHMTGEILIRAPYQFKCYLNNPSATEAVLDSDGWYRSGDAGFYTQDNLLSVVGRIYDLIKVSGNLVSSSEIEDILFQHPSVEDAGVAGFPDQVTGEAPKAFVVVSNQDCSPEELLNFVNQRISEDYKHLKEVHFMESLPRTAAGKLVTRLLK